MKHQETKQRLKRHMVSTVGNPDSHEHTGGLAKEAFPGKWFLNLNDHENQLEALTLRH